MGIGDLQMNRHNKSIVSLAVHAIEMDIQNSSTFMIKAKMSDLIDVPITINNVCAGKRGKKGKSLKDWH